MLRLGFEPEASPPSFFIQKPASGQHHSLGFRPRFFFGGHLPSGAVNKCRDPADEVLYLVRFDESSLWNVYGAS
jgi:hypothetical protein